MEISENIGEKSEKQTNQWKFYWILSDNQYLWACIWEWVEGKMGRL